MGKMSLPPGFRFHPTDVELVMYYLKRKVMGKKHQVDVIAEVNIYKFSPLDLPDKSCLKSKDLEWYFFCPRERKYATGVRVKRATENGYWKTTGKDRPIRFNDKTIGTKKTLVFHSGHASQGERTNWVIHEYRILDDELAAAGLQDAYVLCKVFEKSGLGPKNGAQYGAPFNEEDWSDDDDAPIQATPTETDGLLPTTLMLPDEQTCPLETGLFFPGSTSALPSAEGTLLSTGRPSTEMRCEETDDEITRLLAQFMDEGTSPSNMNGINKGKLLDKRTDIGLPCTDGYEKYGGLNDLDFFGMRKDGCSLNDVLLPDNLGYIEINDLLTPLDGSNGVVGTDHSPVIDILGSFYQPHSGDRFINMDQHASCVHQWPDESYKVDNFMGTLQMFSDQFCDGPDSSHVLDFACGQPDTGVDFTQDMEIGAQYKLSEPFPACAPTAAAPSFCATGGSPMHTKAEVTHGAGECTNEALLLMMMGGSGSCRCKLPLAVSQEMRLSVGHCFLCFVDLAFVSVLDLCCLMNVVSFFGDVILSCYFAVALLLTKLHDNILVRYCDRLMIIVVLKIYIFFYILLFLGSYFLFFGLGLLVFTIGFGLRIRVF